MRFISLAGHTHSSGSRVRLGASVPWPWGTSGPADPPRRCPQALAGRAELLASALEERYRSAQKVLNALLAISKKAREVGFQSAELDGAIAEARRVAWEGTVENGVSIPNYLQARTLLESATTRG